MSLPVNSGLAKQRGCDPVSSNCVVWQGPDLVCIDLCKGDTISEVIAKLATELCILVDQFDLDEYDFNCLAVPVSERPENLQGLIQILIERICALEGITVPGGNPTTTDCPDNCIVSIAPCFYFINGAGDTVTTLPLTDYVNAIGLIICNILDDITVLQNGLDSLQEQVNGQGGGTPINNPNGIIGVIGELQLNKVDTGSLQYQISSKTGSEGVQFITDATRSIENSLIRTQDALGTPTRLYQSILAEGNMGSQARLFGVGNMNSITGWVDNPTQIADTVDNVWRAIDDVREAVLYIQDNCCTTGCGDLHFNWRASLDVTVTSVQVTIFADGSTGFTQDWADCTANTRVTITDESGNSTSFQTNMVALIDNPSGYIVDITSTTVNPSESLTVVAETCFVNTTINTTCEKDYSYKIIASPLCPAAVLTVLATSVGYQFQSNPGVHYIINVYFSGGSTPVTTQIIATPGIQVASSIFGLLIGTAYDFEIVVVDSVGAETPCPRIPFTTLPQSCTPPVSASAVLVI